MSINVSEATREYVVPVATRLPVGRVEWAVTPTRIYGIDRAGQVFVLRATLMPANTRRGALVRLLSQIVGRR